MRASTSTGSRGFRSGSGLGAEVGRRRRHDGPDGVAVVDKPAGWTSHDVVARARKLLNTSRVGHSGTLDPDATGVLLLGVGRATRLLRFTSEHTKSYVCEIVLGTETNTLDAAGEVTATHDMSGVADDDVLAAAAALTGDLLQVPPMVSAVKIDGKRLHELAREGIEVERAPRPVTVSRFDVTPVDGQPGVWRAEVDCSSGTYVRVLAADLGHALGGGAHLRELRRTAIGPFTVADAVALDDLGLEAVRPPLALVADRAAAQVDDAVALDVAHGKVLPVEIIGPPLADGAELPTWWPVLAPDGSLLAIYEPHRGGTAKPAVVLVGSD